MARHLYGSGAQRETMLAVQTGSRWRVAAAALLMAAVVLALGFVLRVEGLEAAANVAQLVSLAPLLVAVTSWARTRRAPSHTDDASIKLASVLGYLADGYGATRDELHRRLAGWPAETVDGYLDGAQLPRWDFIAAYLNLIAGENAWHREALDRRVRGVWQAARDSQAQHIRQSKSNAGRQMKLPWVSGRRVGGYRIVSGPWQVTFITVKDFEKVFAAAIEDDFAEQGLSENDAMATERAILKATADSQPKLAVIQAWDLLEYQLNVVSDRIAAGKPLGWPQVARNFEVWDKWMTLSPAVLELRRLRDHVVSLHGRGPSLSDARRYVSVVEDILAILREEFPPEGCPLRSLSLRPLPSPRYLGRGLWWARAWTPWF